MSVACHDAFRQGIDSHNNNNNIMTLPQHISNGLQDLLDHHDGLKGYKMVEVETQKRLFQRSLMFG